MDMQTSTRFNHFLIIIPFLYCIYLNGQAERPLEQIWLNVVDSPILANRVN